MKQFDTLRKETIGNLPELIAVDNVENQTYLIRRMDMQMSENAIDGFGLTISISGGEAIEKRNGFSSKSEMDHFIQAAQQLWREIDEEKNRYRPN
jgi:hypothetical protein